MVLQMYNGKTKINTTTNTTIKTAENIEIDWAKIPQTSELSETMICCPEVVSVKCQQYLICVNITCNKKVSPYPGERTVTCMNASCRRKMLVGKCRNSYTMELTIEKDGKHYDLTAFPQVVEKVFGNISIDVLEDQMLEMEQFDFVFNKKKIITSINAHK